MKDGFKKIIKTLGIPKLILIVAAGVILLMPFKGLQDDDSSGVTKTTAISSDINPDKETATTIKKEFEDILSSIDGIGKTKVMLTTGYDSGGILKDNTVKVTGVLVAAEAGDNDSIKKEIIEAAEVLFELEPHKIKVMKLR